MVDMKELERRINELITRIELLELNVYAIGNEINMAQLDLIEERLNRIEERQKEKKYE